MDNQDNSRLINVLFQMKRNNQFKSYIDFIQFPFYRNLSLDTRISFEFPLTVFLGQNGCGKSSTLHALSGAPKDRTPYEFWFDTKVDPIEYYNDERKRHSFWYSYNDENGNKIEVVKARIKRKDDPNYWETSRPLRWAGMTSKKRNAPLLKNVIYLDFRKELSAFDKYFYFGNIKNSKARNKQEFIRRKSTSLKKLFDAEVALIKTRNKNLNESLHNLSNEEIKNISFILGKEYLAGKSIKHSLFRNEGYSILFKTNHAKYSEAFAGSGEMAVVRLVLEVLNAPAYSLILLDEPEVSLHPGAQSRLQSFLLNEIKKKKHQIVMSSHSPMFVESLPPEAIKVFYQNPNDGRFIVKEGLNYKESFFHIQFNEGTTKNIYVEDILARNILQAVINIAKPEAANLLNIVFNPGGSSVIKKEFICMFCRAPKINDYVIFDGDQKTTNNQFDYRTLPANELTIQRLKEEILKQTDVEITFSTDGGDGNKRNDQQIDLLKKYIDFYNNNVFYLPGKLPEDIIWCDDRALQLLSNKPNPQAELSLIIEKSENYSKNKFKLLTEQIYGNIDCINASYKMFINDWCVKKNCDFNTIVAILDQIIK